MRRATIFFAILLTGCAAPTPKPPVLAVASPTADPLVPAPEQTAPEVLDGARRQTLVGAVGTFDVATRGSHTAVVWSTFDGPEDTHPAVQLVRFDGALQRDASAIMPPFGGPIALSLVGTPPGWMLAMGAADGSVALVPLDPEGAPAGALRTVSGASTPRLVPRPHGMPLLVFVSSGSVRVAEVKADGSLGWTVAPFTTPPVEPELGSAAFVGDGYLVAQRVGTGVSVARVELDGRVTRVSQPGSLSTEYPQIAWLGDGASLTWADFGSPLGVWFARLDRTGAVIGSPARIAGRPSYNRVPTARAGDSTAVLLTGYTGGTERASSLALAHVDRAGRLGPARQVDAGNTVRHWRLVAGDGVVVAAWITQPRGETWAARGERVTLVQMPAPATR